MCHNYGTSAIARLLPIKVFDPVPIVRTSSKIVEPQVLSSFHVVMIWRTRAACGERALCTVGATPSPEVLPYTDTTTLLFVSTPSPSGGVVTREVGWYKQLFLYLRVEVLPVKGPREAPGRPRCRPGDRPHTSGIKRAWASPYNFLMRGRERPRAVTVHRARFEALFLTPLAFASFHCSTTWGGALGSCREVPRIAA